MIGFTNIESSSGHTIEDAAGSALNERANLQFAGYLKTTDDSTNNRSVVSDAPTEITYENYMAMTPAQKQGTKWLITNAPGHLATNQAIFTLAAQELTFTDTTATVSDQRINTSTYPLIYWADSSIAAAAEAHITSTVSNGQITFTAETAPASALTCDIVFISNAYSGGGSGGGGHVIMDNTGEELPQESNLQFADADVTDDSTNSKTVVKVVRQMTQAEFDELSQSEKAGVIKVTDANAPQMLASQIKASDGNNLDSLVVPYVVDFDVWNAYTEEERSALKAAHPKIHVINVPGADGYIEADLMKKLWENPSPTSAFAAQTVTLNSADYDFLLILYTYAGDNHMSCQIAKKGQSVNLFTCGSTTVGTRVNNRSCDYVSDTSLSFGEGKQATGTSAAITEHYVCTPMQIYGIKSTVSLKISAIASDVSTSASKCIMPDGETTVVQAIFWVDESKFVSHDTSVEYNSSYTAPEDGMYIWYLAGNGTSGASLYSDSNRTKIIASSNKSTDFNCVHIPLKSGQTIYTRNLSGSTHRVLGHYKL